MIDYSIIELNDVYVTSGFNSHFGREISTKKGDHTISDIKLITDQIAHYVSSNDSDIKDKETIGCGSWMIQFVFVGNYIELHELKDVINNENIYSNGLTLSIKFLREQIDLCNSIGIKPSIPLLGQKVALTRDIYDGKEVNGVRYDAPDHMTGWYLTSNSYNGDINTLIVEPIYYLLKERPELAKMLALPSGYRFYLDQLGEDIWLDDDNG